MDGMHSRHARGPEQTYPIGPYAYASVPADMPPYACALLTSGEYVIRDPRAGGMIVPAQARGCTLLSYLTASNYVAGSPPAGWAESAGAGGSIAVVGGLIVITALPGTSSTLTYTIASLAAGDHVLVVARILGSAGGASDSNYPTIAIGRSDLDDYVQFHLDMGSANKSRWYGAFAGRSAAPISAEQAIVLHSNPGQTEDDMSCMSMLSASTCHRRSAGGDLWVGAAATHYVQMWARNAVAGTGNTVISVRDIAIYKGAL